jgi:hypothetical protein
MAAGRCLWPGSGPPAAKTVETCRLKRALMSRLFNFHFDVRGAPRSTSKGIRIHFPIWREREAANGTWQQLEDIAEKFT